MSARPFLKAHERQQIIDLWLSGRLIREICESTLRPRGTVTAVIHRAGLWDRPDFPRYRERRASRPGKRGTFMRTVTTLTQGLNGA